MGFHACQFCYPNNLGFPPVRDTSAMQFSPLSSADVTLRFSSGRTWQFPHTGLLHYVVEHGYLPPADFIADVMGHKVVGADFAQTKSPSTPVGYLQEDGFPKGDVPAGFVQKLNALVQTAQTSNDYMQFRQTRSYIPK